MITIDEGPILTYFGDDLKDIIHMIGTALIDTSWLDIFDTHYQSYNGTSMMIVDDLRELLPIHKVRRQFAT